MTHQPHDCLLNRLFRRRSRKTSELRVTGLCGGNSPVTGEFRAQRASNAENVFIWWRHREILTHIHSIFLDYLKYRLCNWYPYFFRVASMTSGDEPIKLHIIIFNPDINVGNAITFEKTKSTKPRSIPFKCYYIYSCHIAWAMPFDQKLWHIFMQC